jgi:hypothetical protein
MSLSEAKEVFAYWVELHRNSKRGPTPVLSPKRQRIIEKAIKMYAPDGVEVCKDAIEGVLYSSFHMGENASGKKYDSIELLLRDAEHIERFAGLAHDHRASGGDAGVPHKAGVQDFLTEPPGWMQ